MINTLNNCNVCITGKLKRMVRKEAFSKILAEGGYPQKKISRSTDFLVVADDWKVEKYSYYKLQKATEWDLDCITESDFYYLIGVEDENGKEIA